MLGAMTRRPFALPAVALVVAVATAGCSSSGDHKASAPPPTSSASAPAATPAAASTFDMAATLTIRGPYSTGVDAMTAGAPCLGISNSGVDYEDIAAGSPLVVLDNAGATAGVGTLPAGEMTTVDLATRECVFRVAVAGVVGGKGFYSLRVGEHTTEPMTEADFRAGPTFTLSGS